MQTCHPSVPLRQTHAPPIADAHPVGPPSYLWLLIKRRLLCCCDRTCDRMQTVFCFNFRPANNVGRRLRLTNGGYKDLLEAIKKLKAGQTTKEDTVQVARKIFNDGGCEDMFGASGIERISALTLSTTHTPASAPACHC